MCINTCVHIHVYGCTYMCMGIYTFVYIDWSITDLKQYISFRCTIQRFRIFIHYDISALLSLITMCHHTKLLQYYWLYSLVMHYAPVTYLGYDWDSGPLNPLHQFHLPSHPSPPATTCLYLWVSFAVFVLFLRLYI